jgi:crotonobetainyl-CoA:carnitine CoA-transferase CaiB-like acyl-CoA transferase
VAETLPLSGMRVVDTVSSTAELCGRILADLGADVVRVEPPGGDAGRALPPLHDGAGLFHAVRNLGKRAVAIDVATEEGRLSFLDLVGGADVWLESSPPDLPLAPGLDAGEVARRHPRLIVTSITPFGRTGPYRRYVATDPVVGSLAGLLFRAGVPELPPVLPPGTMAYDIGAIVAAFATLTAWCQRLRTGAGQHLDLSVMLACAQTTDWGITSYSHISRTGTYAEVRNGGGPIYNIYPCRDGYIRAAVVTRREWHKMRAWLGEPEFLQDPHWDVGAHRIEARDVIEPLYQALFGHRTMTELSEEGQARGLGVTPLLTPADVLAGAHFSALGSFRPMAVAGPLHGRVASGFFTFDGERVGPRGPAPEVPAAPSPPGGVAWADGPDAVPPDGPPSWAGPDPGRAHGAGTGGRPGHPFAGLRVLDFGVAGAAPEVARLLAEYGADAIRVESRNRPDLFRVLMGTDMSAAFAASNRTKRSFGVDFATGRGVELVLDLIRTADVLVENLPPGTMAGLGLGWEEVRRANPRLVMLSSQLMGPVGPWRTWKGYGANTQPVAGLTHLWSYPDTGPLGANVAYPDHVVGRLGATAVLAALLGRERTGRGCHVEIAQVEVVLNLLADLYLVEDLAPGSVGPRGNDSDAGAPWGVYQCAGEQRWCVVTCRHDRDWERLLDVIGGPAWLHDPALGTAAARRARRHEIDDAITEWTTTRSDRQVMEELQAAGVPAGRMTYISDEPDDPQLVDRGYIRLLDQPPLGPLIFDGPSFTGSDLPDVEITPAPALGEHTREIGADLLGLTPADVESLLVGGVLFAPPDVGPDPADQVAEENSRNAS